MTYLGIGLIAVGLVLALGMGVLSWLSAIAEFDDEPNLL